MRNVILTLTLIGLAQSMLFSQLASPVQSGAYFPGIMGVRDYTNPGFSGIFVIDYNIFLDSNKYFDRNGNETNALDFVPELGAVPIDIDISGYINSLMLVYATPQLDFLGNAQYLFILAPIYATANSRVALGELLNDPLVVDGGASGFGDLTVAPLFLSWGFEKFDLTGGYMFVAPTGRFETGADDNVGLGYWSHILQAAGYYYLNEKATAFALIPSYEFHGVTKDIDVTPGSRFTLEYGISQYVTERLELTAQGGHTWQVGKDSGEDVYWNTSVKDRTSVVGLGVGYTITDRFYTNFKWFTTYGNRQNFKINAFELELLIVPWIKKSESNGE